MWEGEQMKSSSAELCQAFWNTPQLPLRLLLFKYWATVGATENLLCVLFYCDCMKFLSNYCRSGQRLILRTCENVCGAGGQPGKWGGVVWQVGRTDNWSFHLCVCVNQLSFNRIQGAVMWSLTGDCYRSVCSYPLTSPRVWLGLPGTCC